MDFPHRIAQHKSESDSFAIMIYKLRDLGIFRNVTDSDYGIDFELELVEKDKDGKDRVKGHCVKIQVKGSTTMDKVHVEPSVSNIKQTTLNYWAELSYSMPVTAIAVDTCSEELYIADDLFWQATSLLDNSSDDKTIHFRRDVDVKNTLIQLALGYSLTEQLTTHKWFLKNFKKCLETLVLWSGNDTFMEIDNPEECDLFLSMLDNAKVLLHNDQSLNQLLSRRGETIDQFFSVYYHHMHSRSSCFTYADAIELSNIILPLLVKRIKEYNDRILSGTFYWINKEPSYLRDVVVFKIPTFLTIHDLGNVFYDFYRDDEFYNFNPYDDRYFEVSKYLDTVAANYSCPKECLCKMYSDNMIAPIFPKKK